MKTENEKEKNKEECLKSSLKGVNESEYHLRLKEHLFSHTVEAHDCIEDQLYSEISLSRQIIQILSDSYLTA